MRPATLSLTILLTGACSPAPSQPPPAASPPASEPDSADAAPCKTSRCWLALAEAATRRGLPDVAAAYHGRAFAVAREPALLDRWIDVMRTSGQLRRAREVLAPVRSDAEARGEASIVAAIDAALPKLASEPSARPLAPGAADAALVRAYTDAAAGRTDAAAAAFEQLLTDAGPARLAAAADALGPTSTSTSSASSTWVARARARARISFHEQGAALQMVPVETWMTRDVTWRDGQMIALRTAEVLDSPGAYLGLVEVAAPGVPDRRLFLPQQVLTLTLTADGAAMVRSDGPRLVVQHLLTGDITPLAAPGEQVHLLVSVGAGAGMYTLVGDRAGARLWDARGELLSTHTLDGTTPTITRVYTGEGTHHDNILREEATWPVALALTDDAATVAIGGSDSRVHVFDRKRGTTKILAFKWDYQERRPMGGNPDLNLPLALRLEQDGRQLLAAYAHGDLIRWDTRTGKPIRHLRAACGAAELSAVANRYNPAGAPPVPASADDRRTCGRGAVADISGDGTLVASGGIHGVRVRDTTSGAGLAMLQALDLPNDRLSFAPDGTLVLSNLHGAVALWRRGQALERPVAPRPSGPVSPLLASSGIFQFAVDRRTVAWDLAARSELTLTRAADEQVLALAPDGERVALRVGDALEVRELPRHTVLQRVPLPAQTTVDVQFSAAGHVLLDIQTEARTLDLISPQGGPPRRLAIDTKAHDLVLSADGRWLAGLGHGAPLQVWSTATGALQHTLDAGVRHAAFARDGSFIAWLALPQADVRRVELKLQRIGEQAAGPTLEFEGWPQHVSVAPDGAEVLALLEGGDLVRWRPASGSFVRRQEDELIGVNTTHLADDGRTVLLAGYGEVQIRRNDADLTPLATVHALLSGGWLATSRAGAIDGSADAIDHLVTRVTRGDETLLFAGGLGWDGAHVEHVVARALAGEDLAPPLHVRPR